MHRIILYNYILLNSYIILRIFIITTTINAMKIMCVKMRYIEISSRSMDAGKEHGNLHKQHNLELFEIPLCKHHKIHSLLYSPIMCMDKRFFPRVLVIIVFAAARLCNVSQCVCIWSQSRSRSSGRNHLNIVYFVTTVSIYVQIVSMDVDTATVIVVGAL